MVEYETELNLAKNLCERCARPRYLYGLAKYEQYMISKKTEYLNEAQKEFSAAVARNPYNPKINMLQGDIYIAGEKQRSDEFL
jgi:predicted Zn-dependent protease